MPKSTKPGFIKMRGRQRLELTKEILKYRKDGMGVMEIVALLKLSKLAVVHDLYHDGTRKVVKEILNNAALDAYVAFSDAMAISQLYMETTLILMQTGQISFTPEQFGTHVRSTEHLADLFKMINGRAVSMFKDAVAETRDPRLIRAQQRLKELNGQAMNGETIDVEKNPDDEDDD